MEDHLPSLNKLTDDHFLLNLYRNLKNDKFLPVDIDLKLIIEQEYRK